MAANDHLSGRKRGEKPKKKKTFESMEYAAMPLEKPTVKAKLAPAMGAVLVTLGNTMGVLYKN